MSNHSFISWPWLLEFSDVHYPVVAMEIKEVVVLVSVFIIR